MTSTKEQEFEKGFFELAYDKLQSKLQNLLPFLIGFEVVNKTPDETKAVGVFCFKCPSGQILFVPCFFMGGKVKDLDMLYSQGSNQFFPLTEDFAALFLNDASSNMGSAAKSTKEDVRKDMPKVDLATFVTPPRTGKYSIASVVDYVMEANNNVKKAFWKMLEDSPEFTEAVLRYNDEIKVASALVPHPERIDSKLTIISKATLLKKQAELQDTLMLSAEEFSFLKNDALSNGVGILDKRGEAETSSVGIFKFVETFTNPTTSGFYNYVTCTGEIKPGLILTGQYPISVGYPGNSTVVISMDGAAKGTSFVCAHSEVFVKDVLKVQGFGAAHSLFENAIEAAPTFSRYVLIDADLKSTRPFEILENYKDSHGIRRLKVSPTTGDYCSLGKNVAVTLVFTKRESSHIERRGKTLFIPKGYKLFKISNTYGNGIAPEVINSLRPGLLCNLIDNLSEKSVLPLTLATNGSSYFLTIGDAKRKYSNPLQAKIGMLLHYGMTIADADSLISQAEEYKPVTGYIKAAVTGDYSTPLPDPSFYANELGQNTHGAPEYMMTVPKESTPFSDPTAPGVGTKTEDINSAVRQAIELANAGQKEIFDTHSIATLAKHNDPSSKVTEYIPNFVSTLDKLGRILFMLYWETDKFQTMYGKDELPELVELIRSVLKNLGELVIFMKNKFPDLSINTNEAAVDVV